MSANTESQGGKKAAINVGGGVVGALLAAVAIFGLVQQQGSVTQPQKFNAQINYDQAQ